MDPSTGRAIRVGIGIAVLYMLIQGGYSGWQLARDTVIAQLQCSQQVQLAQQELQKLRATPPSPGRP